MKVILDGYRTRETGDVFTVVDGEVVGSWWVDDDVFLHFVPCGSIEPAITDPFLVSFCERVSEWCAAGTST